MKNWLGEPSFLNIRWEGEERDTSHSLLVALPAAMLLEEDALGCCGIISVGFGWFQELLPLMSLEMGKPPPFSHLQGLTWQSCPIQFLHGLLSTIGTITSSWIRNVLHAWLFRLCRRETDIFSMSVFHNLAFSGNRPLWGHSKPPWFNSKPFCLCKERSSFPWFLPSHYSPPQLTPCCFGEPFCEAAMGRTRHDITCSMVMIRRAYDATLCKDLYPTMVVTDCKKLDRLSQNFSPFLNGDKWVSIVKLVFCTAFYCMQLHRFAIQKLFHKWLSVKSTASKPGSCWEKCMQVILICH